MFRITIAVLSLSKVFARLVLVDLAGQISTSFCLELIDHDGLVSRPGRSKILIRFSYITETEDKRRPYESLASGKILVFANT